MTKKYLNTQKKVLLTLFIVGFSLSAFSQFPNQISNNPIFKDTTFIRQALKYKAKKSSLNSLWLFDNPAESKKSIYLKSIDKNLQFEKQPFVINKKPFDNMPTINPKGIFLMPIAKPDSTIKYSMLNKN